MASTTRILLRFEYLRPRWAGFSAIGIFLNVLGIVVLIFTRAATTNFGSYQDAHGRVVALLVVAQNPSLRLRRTL